MLWSAAAALLLLATRTALLVLESAELARRSEPLQWAPQPARLRLLIVGDSTAVGTGAGAPQHSVAGLLMQAFPHLLIDNRARDGATFADLLDQLGGDERYDMLLVQAGGNDVIRQRGALALRSDVERVAQRARQRAALVVWMPAGNVGNAPFFFAPFTWLMTWRSRQLHASVRAVAHSQGAVYVNLFHERADDPFVLRPELNAADGLHASAAGYRVWFTELMAQAELPRRLAAARQMN